MSAWRGVDPSVMAAPEASIATKGRRSPVRFRAFRPENRSCACAALPGARAPIRSRAERAAGVCRWFHPPAKNTTHLGALERAGLVIVADAGPGRTLYEAATRWHHHLICRACGIVVDVPCLRGEKPCLEPELPGVRVDEAQVIFRGLCASCAAREDRQSRVTTPPAL